MQEVKKCEVERIVEWLEAEGWKQQMAGMICMGGTLGTNLLRDGQLITIQQEFHPDEDFIRQEWPSEEPEDGCPYGCDDNGDRVGEIKAEGEELTAGPAAGIKDHRIVIELSEGDFESSMGTRPRDQEEFDNWAALVEKGLLNGHIDWDIVYECACDAMPGDEDE